MSGAILDRMTREGLSEEVTFELSPEESGSVPGRTLFCAKTLKNSTCGMSWEEQGSIWLGRAWAE